MLCMTALATPAAEPAFEVSAITANAGETVKVTITAKNNPGITSAKLMVDYDDTRLNLISWEGNSAWGETFQPSQNLGSPVTLLWMNGAREYAAKESVFVTMTFQVLPTAKPGIASISATYDPEDVFDINFQNVTFALENGGVMVTDAGQETSTITVSAPWIDSKESFQPERDYKLWLFYANAPHPCQSFVVYYDADGRMVDLNFLQVKRTIQELVVRSPENAKYVKLISLNGMSELIPIESAIHLFK